MIQRTQRNACQRPLAVPPDSSGASAFALCVMLTRERSRLQRIIVELVHLHDVVERIVNFSAGTYSLDNLYLTGRNDTFASVFLTPRSPRTESTSRAVDKSETLKTMSFSTGARPLPITLRGSHSCEPWPRLRDETYETQALRPSCGNVRRGRRIDARVVSASDRTLLRVAYRPHSRLTRCQMYRENHSAS